MNAKGRAPSQAGKNNGGGTPLGGSGTKLAASSANGGASFAPQPQGLATKVVHPSHTKKLTEGKATGSRSGLVQ